MGEGERRKVLLCVLGLSPPVVTESLWALAHRTAPDGRPRPFHAAKVHLLTTAKGEADARQPLARAIAALCAEWQLPVPEVDWHLVGGPTGAVLADIRDDGDNVALGDAVLELVGRLTDRDDVDLHASLAGGRKTMSFYLGYCMSLLGRLQDELSHVLVRDERLEFARDENGEGFWYPTKESRPLRYRRQGAPPGDPPEIVDCRGAALDLHEIPFVRLRDYIDDEERSALRARGFRAVVEAVQSVMRPPRLTMLDGSCSIIVHDVEVALPAQQYAMYRLLAETAMRRDEGAGPDGVGYGHRGWLSMDDFKSRCGRGTQGFQRNLERIYEPKGSYRAEDFWNKRVLSADPDPRPAGRSSLACEARMRKIFSPIISKTRSEIEAAIPDRTARAPYAVRVIEEPPPSRFGLGLAPEQITIAAQRPPAAGRGRASG